MTKYLELFLYLVSVAHFSKTALVEYVCCSFKSSFTTPVCITAINLLWLKFYYVVAEKEKYAWI